ncbi:DNA-binding protein [Actinorhabdospora filicis]|uniref:DNA-binding protein n=1 Tax=Actinorhabdospora filicis TaxID=1785913 RepID=A0A9W6WCD9_9ACTN|nr:helix-turn-helix transcriptional regulator [Actinorhabdospora filicis]GLZ80496.1 DNA-binding protein [Actinorhabdospora filicis]
MDRKEQLGEFLRSRRARLRPEEFGLPDYGRVRRVPGLRREELARLAGVSVDHYVRLEQGRDLRFSAEVLAAVARVLRLDEHERAHLFRLARPGGADDADQAVRPGIARLLETFEGVPAYIVGRRVDVLAWNAMAEALFSFGERPNFARYVFLDPASRSLFRDWDLKAADTVAYLRNDAGRHPGDPELAALVGELSIRSAEFRGLWAVHEVRDKTHGSHRFHHPVVGDLDLGYETLRPSGAEEQVLVAYAPGEGSADALRMLRELSSAARDRTGPASGRRRPLRPATAG